MFVICSEMLFYFFDENGKVFEYLEKYFNNLGIRTKYETLASPSK